MAAKDTKQKVEGCPKQEMDAQDSYAPCEATTCDAGEDTGCADCE